jgi:hypothetical protein
MPVWLFIVLATALGGALVIWHNVSKTKHVSEEMLGKYREMLAQARARKAEELINQAADAEESS